MFMRVHYLANTTQGFLTKEDTEGSGFSCLPGVVFMSSEFTTPPYPHICPLLTFMLRYART